MYQPLRASPARVWYAFAQDDNTGRQQFQFLPVHGGFNILLPMGRAGCAGNYLTAAACGSTALTLGAFNTGLQTWSVVAANTPVPPPAPVGPLANGDYYIRSTALATCANALTTSTCSQAGTAQIGSPSMSPPLSSLVFSVWDLTILLQDRCLEASDYSVLSLHAACLSCGQWWWVSGKKNAGKCNRSFHKQ